MSIVVGFAVLVLMTASDNVFVLGIQPSSSSATPDRSSPSDRLADMLMTAREQQHAVRLVGVHDALSARVVQRQHAARVERQQLQQPVDGPSNANPSPQQQMGLFVSGFGVSASRLGRPDVSILTRSEQEDTARNIVQAVTSADTVVPPPPVIVDGDTGFGGTANVRETIRRMAAIRAAAVTIEDQEFPKQCTYMAGKGVATVPREDAVRRVRAALAARNEASEIAGTPISVVARTDCRMGHGLDEAIERCLAFQELGADVVYAENLQSRDEYVALRKAMIGGENVTGGTRGVAPMILAQFQTGAPGQRLYPIDEVSAMGYEMTLYGVTGLQATVSALESVAAEIFEDGGIVRETPLSSLNEMKDVVGFSDLDSFEQKYGCT